MTKTDDHFRPMTKLEARAELRKLRDTTPSGMSIERLLRTSEIDCWTALEYVQRKFEQEIGRIKLSPEYPVELQSRAWYNFITLLLKEMLYNPSGNLASLAERVSVYRDTVRDTTEATDAATRLRRP